MQIYWQSNQEVHLLVEDRDRDYGNGVWQQKLAPFFALPGMHIHLDINKVSVFSSLLLGRLIRFKLDIERFGGRLHLHPAAQDSALLPQVLSWQSFFTFAGEMACHNKSPRQPDPQGLKASKDSTVGLRA